MHGKKIAIAAAALLTAGAVSRAATLGTANDYNVFILNNLSKTNVDVQGNVAVGNDATINNYSTATSVGTAGSFIVGHNLTQTGGGTQNGNVVVGNTATLNSPTITGKLEVNGNVTIAGGGTVSGGVQYKSGSAVSIPSYYSKTAVSSVSVPVNFPNEISYLTQASTQWGNLSQTGTVSSAFGNLTLAENISSSLDVFDVSASLLATASSLTINVAHGPGGVSPTVLVNVVGSTSATLSSFGTFLNGVNKQDVLYNFPTETAVNFSAIGIEGSVLAPYASVNFNNGDINGTLVANNLTGTGEEHLDLFQGDLPGMSTGLNSVVSVPEPASLSILAPAAIFVMRRRKR